jgi:hypothetical protein
MRRWFERLSRSAAGLRIHMDRHMFANRRNMKAAIWGACCTFVMGRSVSGLNTVQSKVFLQVAAWKWCRECMVYLTSKCGEKISFSMLETDILFHNSSTSIGHRKVVSWQFLPVVAWDKSFSPFGILEGGFSSLKCRIMTAETKLTSS